MKRKKISIDADTDPTQIDTDRGRSARTPLGLRTRKSPASPITINSPHTFFCSLTCECNIRLHCAQLIVPKNLRVTRCTHQHPPIYSNGNTTRHIAKGTLSPPLNHHLTIYLSSPLFSLPSPLPLISSPHTCEQLITDLPDEPMQIVFSSLGPKDIVFWSWVDKNCQRKVLQYPFLSPLPSLSPLFSPLL